MFSLQSFILFSSFPRFLPSIFSISLQIKLTAQKSSAPLLIYLNSTSRAEHKSCVFPHLCRLAAAGDCEPSLRLQVNTSSPWPFFCTQPPSDLIVPASPFARLHLARCCRKPPA